MKRKLLFCFICLLFVNVHSVESPAMLSAVLNEAITSLTKLYEMYDQTMNQIEMIEQKYEQMQFYIDRAANWKWEDIEWDGDLDFRNEITQATKQVDKQLTNIRRIKDSLTSNTLTWGGQSFSIASLAGIKIDGQGNLEDYIKEGSDYYSEGFKKAAKVWEEGVSDKEASYIWSKYGLTPANYKMVRDVENKLYESTAVLIGSIENSPEKQEIENESMKIIENIIQMLETEGATPDQIASVNAMLQEQTIFSLKELQKSLEQAMGYMAWYNQLQAQKEEAEKQSKAEKMQEAGKNSVPGFW